MPLYNFMTLCIIITFSVASVSLTQVLPVMENVTVEVCVMLTGNLDRNVTLSLRTSTPENALDTALGITYFCI